MIANESRLGRSRRPVRALVVGLLLTVAIGAGVGVAAFAMGATEAPETGVPAAVPATAVGGVSGGAGIVGESTSSPAGPSTATDRNSAADPAGSAPDAPSKAPSPAATVPGPFLPTQPGSVDGPATVSTLAPGDPGFGWPSSAFGSTP